jgi:hypothetical protein
MIALDAAIELLGKYQSELQVKAIHLNLAANGDVNVSIVPAVAGNEGEIFYGRIDRLTKHLIRTERPSQTDRSTKKSIPDASDPLKVRTVNVVQR